MHDVGGCHRHMVHGFQRSATISSEDTICEVQLEAPARMRALWNTDGCLITSVGRTTLDDKALCTNSVKSSNVLWIPDQERMVQARLMAYVCIQEAGHRGVAGNLHRLPTYLCVRQCLG